MRVWFVLFFKGGTGGGLQKTADDGVGGHEAFAYDLRGKKRLLPLLLLLMLLLLLLLQLCMLFFVHVCRVVLIHILKAM